MYACAGTPHPATGAAAVAATPRFNNAPTFDAFTNQVIDFVTAHGNAAPLSSGDGINIGAFSRPSQEALKCIPVELWDKRGHDENSHVAARGRML